MRKILPGILFLLSIATAAWSQVPADTLRGFNKVQSEQYLQDDYYSYDDVPVDESESWLSTVFRRFFRNILQSSDIRFPNESILYVLGAFILFIILRNSKISWKHLLSFRDRKAGSAVEIETEAQNVNYLQLASDAELKEMYALAVRYRFLHCLNLMAGNGIISTDENRTNWEYARVIGDAEIRKQFLGIIAVYDRIWYGEYEVTADTYAGMVKEIGVFNQNLKRL